MSTRPARRAPARMHPLGSVLVEVIDGRFPEPDGSWSRVPLWRPGVEGAVALTGRAFLAVGDEVSDTVLTRLGVDGLGGATNARTTMALAGGGYVECLDMLLGRRAPEIDQAPALVERPDLAQHPRPALARQLRSDVRVFGLPDGDAVIVTLSRGVGDLSEIGIEVAPQARGDGAGIVRAALATLPPGTPVLAACSPGNARAVRTFVAAGFAPLGEVQLWCPERAGGAGRTGV